jgi:LPXTG-site transpeptidase (sortase) family protein
MTTEHGHGRGHGDGHGDGHGHDHEVGATRSPKRRRTRGRIASLVSFIGELLITAGLVLGLFVVYSLWWTNVIADRAARKDGDTIRRQWAAQAPRGPGKLDTGNGIGFLHIPAMGKDYEVLVTKGTSTSVLNEGVAGYYTHPVKSAMPWDKSGNFTLAAHRDGHGAKFHNIDKIKPGAPVVFEDRDTWFVYKVYKVLPQTSKYNVKAINQIPKESGKKKAGRYLTLTTCTPVYTSEYRYIVWAELVRTQKVDAERTLPAELR